MAPAGVTGTIGRSLGESLSSSNGQCRTRTILLYIYEVKLKGVAVASGTYTLMLGPFGVVLLC